MHRRFIGNQTDIVYVNSTLYNDTSSDIVMEYDTTFSSAIIENSGEFQLAIVRFNIPNTIPIFEFKPNAYYVTLSYNNQDYTVPVVFQNVDTRNPSSRNVYTFQQFIDMINTALESAFTNMVTADPGVPTTEPPFMVFNHETDIFSLYTQQSYEGGVDIFFNYELYSFFYNSFKVENRGVNLPDRKDYKFIISDERNNIPISPPNYYEFKQQIITLFEWYDFQSIVFTSSSLPTRSEYITSRTSDGRSINQPIVTDFVPELGKDRSNFVYNADPYRMVDLNGHSKIFKFDFRVLYINKGGGIKPLTLPPNFGMNVKFAFIRKDISQNYYV